MPGSQPKAEPIPHDRIFKLVFRYFLAELIEIVEPGLARLLDLSHPRFLDKEAFTDLPGGQRADLDLVAEAPLRGRRGKPPMVLIHVETERRFRRATARRLWRYAMHLALKYDRPVVTIVVFLEGGPPGISWCEYLEKLGRYEIHRFRYLGFGLSGSVAELYLQMHHPLAAALAALMRSETLDRPAQKLECLRRISQAELDDARRFLLNTVVDSYIQLRGSEAERYEAELRRETNQEVREMVITWEEALTDRETRGEERGKLLGKEEGELLGQLKTLRNNIRLLLQRRFSRPAEDIQARLETIDDPNRLGELFEKAIDARSLEELGLVG